MKGRKDKNYATNGGKSTDDVQTVMEGTTGTRSTEYYLGIYTVDTSDLNFTFGVDGCDLVFNE